MKFCIPHSEISIVRNIRVLGMPSMIKTMSLEITFNSRMKISSRYALHISFIYFKIFLPF